MVELNTTGAMNGNNCGDTSNTTGLHQNDWRLPNIRELHSLVDFGRVNPALPALHPFTNFDASDYWSSTTVANVTLVAWFVDFTFGDVGNFNKSIFSFVTAVRGGS